MIIGMIEDHMVRFPEHTIADRLASVDLTRVGFKRLKEGFERQRLRESAIPEEDVAAAVQFTADHPDIGAGKAQVSLIDKEAAYLSTGSLNQMKQELKEMVSQEYQQRKEAEKLLEAQLRMDLLDRRSLEYEHFQAKYPNHVWSMDFSQIMFLGTPFMLCEVYDEYSQSYLSLQMGFYADQQLVRATFQEALARTNAKPAYLRRDNGKAFETENFKECLGQVKDYPIPPGSPWLNGSLESCHTSLKAAIKTTAMQDMSEIPKSFREARRDPAQALELLQGIVDRVRVMVNEDISRLKHGMPPDKVYRGEEDAVKVRHREFVEKKKRERRERMHAIRAESAENRIRSTFLDKVRAAGRKIIDEMGTNALYVLNEALHRRYKLCET